MHEIWRCSESNKKSSSPQVHSEFPVEHRRFTLFTGDYIDYMIIWHRILLDNVLFLDDLPTISMAIFHGHFFSLLEVAEISHHSQPTPRLCYNAMDISEAKEIFPTWDFMVDFPNKNGIWITTKIFQRLVTYKHQNTGIHGAQGRWRERWSMWVRLQAKPDCSRCPMETRALVRFVIRTFPAFVALNQWSSIHSFPLSWYFYVFLRSKPCFFFSWFSMTFSTV